MSDNQTPSLTTAFLLTHPVQALDFERERTKTALYNSEIKTVLDLVSYKPFELKTMIDGIGKTTLDDIKHGLEKVGLKLGDAAERKDVIRGYVSGDAFSKLSDLETRQLEFEAARLIREKVQPVPKI